MNPKYKSSWDLMVIIILSGLLIISTLLIPDLWLRVIIGLPFLLFFPGYAFIAFLFPEKKSLGIIERLALSFGLSIAITPLIGFGLNYMIFGIRLEPILFSVTLFNVALSLAAYWRRDKVQESYLPFDPKILYGSLMSNYRKERGLDKVLTIILVISILSSIVVLAYVGTVPREGEKFTEFYILGPYGKASDYPHNLTIGQNASLIVGIANHEYRQVHYFVQLWLVNASFIDNQTMINQMYYFDSFDVTLDHTAVNLEGPWTSQWQQNYTFNVSIEGEYKLWFFLFKDNVPDYAQGLNRMADYAGTATDFLLQDAVQNKLLSLNLNLRVN
jgi:uncharacterized membrane protein